MSLLVKKYVKGFLNFLYRGVSIASPIWAEKICVELYALRNSFLDRSFKIDVEPLERNHANLLIDITETAAVDLKTGIQRTVNHLLNEFCEKRKDVIPVRSVKGKLVTGSKDICQELPFQKGDRLLFMDSSWKYVKSFSRLLDDAKTEEVLVYGVVYDIFPLLYPELFDSRLFVNIFRSWQHMLLQRADAIICISRTAADTLARYYQKIGVKRKHPLKIYWTHMGVDSSSWGGQHVRTQMLDFLRQGKTFLMVGTIEPRKGHMIVLQALEALLTAQRSDCRLLILGRNGWKNNEILQQMDLPLLRHNVLWVKDASDEELRWAYANTDALIAASKDEGFGLPLIEAAYFGLPIICSDIPIFREVTQGHADYFKVMDADSLAECLATWLREETHPDSHEIHIYTWEEAAKEILDIVYGKAEPYKILE